MVYQRPKTLSEAVGLLAAADGTAHVIAGGTDLMLDLESGKHSASLLIDVSALEGHREICIEGNELVLGCGVTHTMAARSPLVQRYAPALARACRSVGSLQIRNIATVVGNVVNAQPAADAAVALAALGARFAVAESGGVTFRPLAEMYAGFGKSTIDSSRQLVYELRLPLQRAGEGSAFVRLELRKALALPMLNTAAMLRVENGRVAWARIAMAPVGVGPVRAATAEQWLAGRVPDAENIRAAANMALNEANPRTNLLRGTREFRMEVLPVLVRRALEQITAAITEEGESNET